MTNIARTALALVFVSILVSAVGTAAAATAGKDGDENSLLIRVQRESTEDLERLLAAGAPVVMEMRGCLFVEGGPDALRLLDGRGCEASILDTEAAGADYLVLGLRPDEVYIVAGHLDALPMTLPAPGADDNASGSVTVLEAARVMSCYAFESTVKYLNVTGEESGLLGSDAYADDAWARGEDICGVINMDMNAWEGDGSPDP